MDPPDDSSPPVTAGVTASARELQRSAHAVEESSDLSTQLAATRTLLAAERTYAAWVRTALAAVASGVGRILIVTNGSLLAVTIAALISLWVLRF